MGYTLGYELIRQSYTKTTRQCGVHSTGITVWTVHIKASAVLKYSKSCYIFAWNTL
jgi:hypothetical protein